MCRKVGRYLRHGFTCTLGRMIILVNAGTLVRKPVAKAMNNIRVSKLCVLVRLLRLRQWDYPVAGNTGSRQRLAHLRNALC